MSKLPDFGKIEFSKSTPVPLEDLCPDAADVALELLKKFLVYPSEKRIPATKVKYPKCEVVVGWFIGTSTSLKWLSVFLFHGSQIKFTSTNYTLN